MDKKKVLTALSILGLSGGLMFSVSALSADTVVDSGSSILSMGRDTPPPSCSNPNVNLSNPNCPGYQDSSPD